MPDFVSYAVYVRKTRSGKYVYSVREAVIYSYVGDFNLENVREDMIMPSIREDARHKLAGKNKSG